MPSNKRLYVGSVPFITTEGELLKIFVQEGKVIDVTLMLDDHRRSKGQGFVEFENEEDAIRAKDRFHGYKIYDRKIIVDFAKTDPLETEVGQKNYLEAIERRGERFTGFDRRLERKQGRLYRSNKNQGPVRTAHGSSGQSHGSSGGTSKPRRFGARNKFRR